MRPGRFHIVVALASGFCQPAMSQTASPAAAEQSFLDSLAGDWIMEGQVMGERVRYRARGERVLRGAWVEIRMTDVGATPPAYDARVYLGWDDRANDYVVHWLDDSGAPGARVAGLGNRAGDTLTIMFPYASGTFRNRWIRSAGGWRLVADAQQPDGSWRNFGDLTARRP